MTQDKIKFDGVNLPPSSIAESLSAPLHDGELLSIRSDLLKRTVVLEIDVPHIRGHHRLGNEIHFFIHLKDVESARVTTWMKWPGPVPEMRGKSSEEQDRLVNEYQKKWREESVSWSVFVDTFPEGKLDIYAAEAISDESAITLKIQGELNGAEFDDQSFDVFIRAKEVTIEQSNGIILTLEQFVKLGEDYWEAWSNRHGLG